MIVVPRDYLTIQAAIDAVDDGETVWVRPGIYQTNFVVDKSIVLKSLVGKEYTILDGGLLDRVINVIAPDVTIDGFSVINGVSAGHGGGILFDIGAHRGAVLNSRIANNKVDPTKMGGGGGIAAYKATDLSVYNTIVDGNESTRYSGTAPFTNGVGGGIYTYDSPGLVISHLLAQNNIARLGGAIATYYVDTGLTGIPLDIRNSIFWKNEATFWYGGAICSYGLLAPYRSKYTNCTFCDNKASYGGALGLWGRSLTGTDILHEVKNCILFENPTSYGYDYQIYTLLYPTGPYPCIGIVELTYSLGHSLVMHPGAGNIVANPLFIDQAGGDFHLTPMSTI